jgi:predicted dithiol-disulfide oxidoreductase (DUF899 family)
MVFSPYFSQAQQIDRPQLLNNIHTKIICDFTTGRGVETLGTVWTLLNLTPLGRQEKREDSPDGTPQIMAKKK